MSHLKRIIRWIKNYALWSVVFILLIIFPNIVVGEDKILVKDVILSKQKLLHISWGEKYVAQINTITEKLNDKKLIKILSKVVLIEKKLNKKNDIRSQKAIKLLWYLKVRILYILQKKWTISPLINNPENSLKENDILLQNTSTITADNVEYKEQWNKYYHSGQYQKAIESYLLAIKYNSNDFEPYYRIGSLYYVIWENDKSRVNLLKASVLKPEYSYIFDGFVGLTYADQWDSVNAKIYIKKSLDANNTYYISYQASALLAKQKNDSTKYIEYLKKEIHAYETFFKDTKNKEISEYLLSVFPVTINQKIATTENDIWEEYVLLENYQSAEIHFQRAVNKYGLILYYYNLWSVQIENGSYESAENNLLQVLQSSNYSYLPTYEQLLSLHLIDNKKEKYIQILTLFKKIINIYDEKELWESEIHKNSIHDTYNRYHKQLSEFTDEVNIKTTNQFSGPPEWYEALKYKSNTDNTFSNKNVLSTPRFNDLWNNIYFNILNYNIENLDNYDWYLNDKKISSGIEFNKDNSKYFLKNTDFDYNLTDGTYSFYLKNNKTDNISYKHIIYKWNIFDIKNQNITCNLDVIRAELYKNEILLSWTKYDNTIDITYDFNWSKLKQWKYSIYITCWYLDIKNKKWGMVFNKNYSIDKNGNVINNWMGGAWYIPSSDLLIND